MTVTRSRQTRRTRRARRNRAKMRAVAASTGRKIFVMALDALAAGAARNLLLFIALLGSFAGAVASVLAGKEALAIMFVVLALVLCAVLWLWEE